MGCITASGWRVGLSPTVVGAKASDDIVASGWRVGLSPIVSGALVCTVEEFHYLEVTPDTVWLTANFGSSAEFMVVSNVNWKIE